MGDMNAKVGTDNTGEEEVMGIHGIGQVNDNGRTEKQIDHFTISKNFRPSLQDVRVMDLITIFWLEK